LRQTYLTPNQIQGRLLILAALFILALGIALSISPAVREQSWQVDYRLNHWVGILAWLVFTYAAHRYVENHLPDADPYLLPIAALLSGWGMLSIWRLTNTFGFRQAAWVAVCFIILILLLRRNEAIDFLRRYKYIWLTSGLLLTALTFVLGANPMGFGPRLWLGCCGIYLQPSEPLKLLLVVYLAAYFADKIPISRRIIPLILPTLFLFGLALAILLIQRDLGTASLFVALYAVMVYLASGKRRILLLSGALLIAFGLAGYFFIDLIEYRLTAWLDPWQDPSGRSYQVIQSLLATANGGIVGRGMGLGAPGVVPVAHSDFIFTAIAEETGLIGTLALFLLIGLLVSRCFVIALRAESNFERLLSAGLGAYIGIQSIVIVGGNLRLLPLTGVTLPFVSYGGSSLLTSFLALLLLLQISNKSDHDPAPLNSRKPYLVVSSLIAAGLVALMLANGWWSIIRAEDLLNRYDNPRRSIADRFVPRGSLLDRRNQPITYTEGTPGEYSRVYAYPALSSITGYTHGVYGQAGLEAQLDSYLRGLQGYPYRQIWWQRLLYGTPPPGLDVRLTLDLELQRHADNLLGDQKGAAVLINARTGEILVMASHPTFDANLLDEIGRELLTAADAPLLNRAIQGQYAPGTSLTPFLLAELFDAGLELPAFPPSILLEQDGRLIRCTLRQEGAPDWQNALPAGCPKPLITLANTLGEDVTNELIQKLGMTTSNPTLETLAIGDAVTTTPLNMALMSGAISNQGIAPAAQFTLALNTPTQGWISLLPQGQVRSIFSAQASTQTAQLLQVSQEPYWESMGRFESRSLPLVWYLGGTLPSWQGTPLAIAVVIESDQPELAQKAGRGILEAATEP
jgi:cell division protein FtsW (lipid II flippase)